MKTIVVGAGNIGRWHIHSLLQSEHVNEIHVIEPRKKNIKLLPNENRIKIVSEPEGNYDVAIVATNANERYLSTLKVKNKSKYIILEKFLFNNILEYKIDFNDNIVYVNCPRRAMKCYEQFRGHKPTIFYYGIDGLLSNSIHFADLLCYLSDYNIVEYDIDLCRIRKSKRKGYYDAEGRIIIKAGEGMAYLHTTRIEGKPVYTINDFLIDEDKKLIRDIYGIAKAFDYKYQSELTKEYISDIIQIGECRLAKYEESKQWHLEFLRQLKEKRWKYNIT